MFVVAELPLNMLLLEMISRPLLLSSEGFAGIASEHLNFSYGVTPVSLNFLFPFALFREDASTLFCLCIISSGYSFLAFGCAR